MNAKRVSALLAVLFPFILLLALSPALPVMQKLFNPASYLFIRAAFGTVCHQSPLKCPGGNAFLCYRCLGIYTGVWLGAVSGLFSIYIIQRKTLAKVLSMAILFLVTDVILHNFGIYYYIPLAATTTGLFFGFSLQQFITK